MHLVNVYFWSNTEWRHITRWVVTNNLERETLVGILNSKGYFVDTVMGFWIRETVTLEHGAVFSDTNIGYQDFINNG